MDKCSFKKMKIKQMMILIMNIRKKQQIKFPLAWFQQLNQNNKDLKNITIVKNIKHLIQLRAIMNNIN